MFPFLRPKVDHNKNFLKTKNLIQNNTNRQIVWSGIITTVLASTILSIGRPLWDIAVINPLILAKVKQDLVVHTDDHKLIEKRMDEQEKLLAKLDQKILQIIDLLDRFDKIR